MALKTCEITGFAKIDWALKFTLNYFKILSPIPEWFNTLYIYNQGLSLSDIDMEELFSKMPLEICWLFYLKVKGMLHRYS